MNFLISIHIGRKNCTDKQVLTVVILQQNINYSVFCNIDAYTGYNSLILRNHHFRIYKVEIESAISQFSLTDI